MSDKGEQGAVDADFQNYLKARDKGLMDLLVHATQKTGRSPVKTQFDFMKLARAEGRLNMVEYIRFGLYDPDRFTPEERARFISNDLNWPITHICNDKSWEASAEDKYIADRLLGMGDVPVPDTVAVIDTGPRLFPGLTRISNAPELRDFLLSRPGQRLFGKVNGGMVSFGVFRVEHCDEDTLTCTGMEPMSYEAFLSDFVGTNSYVIQTELNNHPDIARYCSSLATVRVVNMVRQDDVYCPVAVIKMPQGGNIADAFWRPGNLACDIDMETGEIRTVALRGTEIEFLDDHPETPGLMGMNLPFWKELLEINDRAARIFAPIRFQSTDIAITENGPVVVELNYGGGFDLPQYASGRGMLTPEVRAFFKDCGYEFTPKKRGLGRLFGRK